jgi:hypothetical protein
LFTSIMPSVAMNGGSFNLATKVPEKRPLTAPVAMAASTPVHSGSCQ